MGVGHEREREIEGRRRSSEEEAEGIGRGAPLVRGDGVREETRESGGSGRGVRARVRRDWWGRLGLGLGPAREVGRPRLLGSFSLSL